MVNGQFKTIIIDDYIPVKTTNPYEPAFSKSRSRNIWVILLEKAWAKLNGSYEAVIGGSQRDAFTFLTPYPVKKFMSYVEATQNEG